MERFRLDFSDPRRPERSGSFVLDDDGRVYLRTSPALAGALIAAREDRTVDTGPLRFDDPRRGPMLASALTKGVRAPLLRCEHAAGAFELRGYVDKGWVRLNLAPGDFDPDAAWEFLVAMNEASLEAPLA